MTYFEALPIAVQIAAFMVLGGAVTSLLWIGVMKTLEPDSRALGLTLAGLGGLLWIGTYAATLWPR